MKWVLAAITVVLIVVHQDFWNWNKLDLAFGFLPVGLWYHALYCVAAAVLMWLLVSCAWPKQLEDVEAKLPPETGGGHGH